MGLGARRVSRSVMNDRGWSGVLVNVPLLPSHRLRGVNVFPHYSVSS
jgi:hypothetical protein